MTIRPYQGKLPEIAKSAYIDPAAIIIGDVKIGEDSSIWPLTVVRGDVHYIRIGARTNIQDGSVLHVMRDEYPLILGDDVTVGHKVCLHGCTIANRCLIGMGSIILNGVTIGEGSIVAAGALILERTVIPPGSLVVGHPAKIKRQLTGIDQASIDEYARRYVAYKNIYRDEAASAHRRQTSPATSRLDSGALCEVFERCQFLGNRIVSGQRANAFLQSPNSKLRVILSEAKDLSADVLLQTDPLDRAAAVELLQHAPLDELLSAATALRAKGKGSLITFSKKVFIPLTTLCRDYCGYCTFRKDPGQPGAHFMTPDEVLAVAEQGRRAGCKEALFSSGRSTRANFPRSARLSRRSKASRARSIISPRCANWCSIARGCCLIRIPA